MVTQKRAKPNRLVRRLFAERYLLITLLSFAASVSLTRLFLELTGYPQLGNSTLHIAHVLWGGLILFAGCLLPLIFINRRAMNLSALLAGIGIGLFIDEVGKFITQANDYFFPAAAPIVYALFLVTLYVYTLVRKSSKSDPRTALYHVLEQFEEVLDGDLSDVERDRMIENLEIIAEGSDELQLRKLGERLLAYLQDHADALVVHRPDFFEKITAKWERFEKRMMPKGSYRKLLVGLWIIWGLVMMLRALLSWGSSSRMAILPELGFPNQPNPAFILSGLPFLIQLRVFGELLAGFSLIISALLMILKSETAAMRTAQISLVFSLAFIYILVFYYDQFSSIIFSGIQFAVLIVTIRFRQRFDHERQSL